MAKKIKVQFSPTPDTTLPSSGPAEAIPTDSAETQVATVAKTELEPAKTLVPTENPRNAILKSLHRSSLSETGSADAPALNDDESDIDGDVRPNREEAARAAADAANAAAEGYEDPGVGADGQPVATTTPPPIAPEPVAPTSTRRIEVRGVVQEVPIDQVIAAGEHALRHRGAAELALREASELLTQARVATAAPAGTKAPASAPASDITDDARQLAEALQLGSREDAAKAVAAMMKGGHSDTDIQGVVARTVETHVRDVLDHESAAKALEAQVPEMLKDHRVMAILGHEERAARANGDNRPYTQLYPDIGKKVREWIDGLKGPAASTGAPSPTDLPARTLEQRRDAKAATPPAVPPQGAPASATTQSKPRTGSDIVAEMRNRRGNPDLRYTRRI